MRSTRLQARRVNPQRDIAESLPAPQHPPQSEMQRRNPAARNETATATSNAGDSAENFRCGRSRIVVRHRVSPRNPRNAILVSELFDQPVNKKAVVAQN